MAIGQAAIKPLVDKFTLLCTLVSNHGSDGRWDGDEIKMEKNHVRIYVIPVLKLILYSAPRLTTYQYLKEIYINK